MKKYLSLFFGLALLGCQQTELLIFETKTYEEKACYKEYCATVELTYPLYVGSTESAVYLNEHIEQQLSMMAAIGEDFEAESLSLAITNFLDSYLQFMEEFDAYHEWSLDLRVRETFQGKDMISLVVENYSYTGGAHPNYFLQYVNFSKQSNSIISNEELVLDHDSLLAIAEKKFRAYHEVQEEVDLAQDGRFFLEDDSRFFLPVTMGVDGDDFILFYNPYEIGPYVIGATELRIPLKELNGIVRKVE
ncbi:DUF3298 and DUF4163 domain-containing protein [Mongoliitalea daihaiensis]|uniref:DUF3298 and DUF4163 domain-containing protein n=1 Tax=Mongoliitalea daihaiensis TaxID=2782006 RepID=UPI001F1BA2A2|nr:DUF3298 and DUF4163 domain-containing protein [Mongoliitalea daihaiensis]UJP64986.1 DUF4163 domain-containing protein [Mongoliitalea daihaiensis]